MRKNVSNEYIEKLLAQGKTQEEVAFELGISKSNVSYRMKKQRELKGEKTEKDVEQKKDSLQKYDTLSKKGEFYRVIEIDDKYIYIKALKGQFDNLVSGEIIQIEKTAYENGTSGYRKANLAPVTTYNINEMQESKQEDVQKEEQATSETADEAEAVRDSRKYLTKINVILDMFSDELLKEEVREKIKSLASELLKNGIENEFKEGIRNERDRI